MPEPLARILVDGYSLLFSCPALSFGAPSHSYQAREALVQLLTQYSDATGFAITVVFDGQTHPTPAQPGSNPKMEVLYSRTGQTADEIIERATHRLLPYGAVWVVTDDNAERDTVLALGGLPMSCAAFLLSVEEALREFGQEMRSFNSKEQRRFKERDK